MATHSLVQQVPALVGIDLWSFLVEYGFMLVRSGRKLASSLHMGAGSSPSFRDVFDIL